MTAAISNAPAVEKSPASDNATSLSKSKLSVRLLARVPLTVSPSVCVPAESAIKNVGDVPVRDRLVAILGPVAKTTVEPLPVVVAAEIAVPLPARAGALTVVANVIAGVVVLLATEPLKPFAVTTETDVTVPPPVPLAVLAIVIEPPPLVIVIPLPAVNVDLVSVLPLVLPISN